jgi:hypothetical protein
VMDDTSEGANSQQACVLRLCLHFILEPDVPMYCLPYLPLSCQCLAARAPSQTGQSKFHFSVEICPISALWINKDFLTYEKR